jgi:phytoene dehydrogenase-like protein
MQLTVVGGGLTGLVAAIEGAEHGWRVTVHEARSTLGGRAGTLEGLYRANRGPHALHTDGPLWSWLEQRGLTPPVVAPCGETLFRIDGRLQPRPAAIAEAIAALPATAPVGDSFRTWLSRHIDDLRLVEAVIGLMFIVTYDHDPGRLSAAFVHERLRRGGQHVRYVQGGWARMIDGLAERAVGLGIELRRGARVKAVPDGPTVLATALPAARRLTGDPGLNWSGTRVALFDFGLGPATSIGWFRLFDLDQRIYAARYSEVDPSLAPEGHHLIQIAAALEPGEPFTAALARVHELLDVTAPGWADDVRWKRAYELADETGAVDLPGTSWHDRPAVLRSPTLALASDHSAAAGLLTEVAHNAARSAIASFRGAADAVSTRRPGSLSLGA